jgi:large subunit ribosomal protein L7/L12
MAAGPPPEAEQREFKVILTAHGKRLISVIKVVGEITGLGLREAKDLVEQAPQPVKQGVSREEAEAVLKKLKKEGAEAEIR